MGQPFDADRIKTHPEWYRPLLSMPKTGVYEVTGAINKLRKSLTSEVLTPYAASFFSISRKCLRNLDTFGATTA
jgi:hypothetical protein